MEDNDKATPFGDDLFDGLAEDTGADDDAGPAFDFEAPPASPASRPAPGPTLTTPSNEGSMNQLFERTEEIGSGGIGTVYRGRQVRLNRDVAIKEIREIFNVFAGVQRDDIIDRFTDIIQTQATLLHPNIIQIVDLETGADYPYVVTQFAPNGNLRRLIDVDGRPPLRVAMKYFMQILHALNAAHDAGVVHGGIKPENVVLDAAGNALVSDFGISRVVERDGGRGNQVYVGVGTVAYMSPEQFQNPNVATVKSDIYSLGIMFYEMLTGKVPGRRSPMPSSFFPDIPRKLDDIFDRMSMDDEEDRYDSIDEIVADIYGAEEVMSIFDKRSGVLFLRDPIVHGEVGLVGVEVETLAEGAGDYSTPAFDYGDVVSDAGLAEDSSDASLAEDSSDASLAEDSSDVEELGDADSSDAAEVEDSVEDSGDAADSAADEADEAYEGGEADDVLDKLDKYGALFEED